MSPRCPDFVFLSSCTAPPTNSVTLSSVFRVPFPQEERARAAMMQGMLGGMPGLGGLFGGLMGVGAGAGGE